MAECAPAGSQSIPAAIDRARQHGLPEGDAGQRRGVEARERVKRIALDVGARDRRVQECEIEGCVVTDQDRARAVGLAAPRVRTSAKERVSASFSGIAGRSG